MRIEIVEPLQLDPRAMAAVDRHSLLNLFNVLHAELEALAGKAGEPRLRLCARRCVELLAQLAEPGVLDHAELTGRSFAETAVLLKELAARRPDCEEDVQALLEVLEVAAIRLGEYQLDRYEWMTIPCAEFHTKLVQFLSVTQRVSRGRFHFVYASGKRDASSYQIEFRIEAANHQLKAPPVLHDVIRDLVGNARKYAPPSTHIAIRLAEAPPNGLRLAVSDQGIGIPADEVHRVVEFGYRASNARHRKTMGGGFGLTKAYAVCKRFGGRFFIESKPGLGTTVEMTLFEAGMAGVP